MLKPIGLPEPIYGVFVVKRGIMPNFAYIHLSIQCPQCTKSFEDLFPFQWGYCPGYLPRDYHIYHLGDAIHWHQLKNHATIPWTYFKHENKTNPCNIGDPSLTNLLVCIDFIANDVGVIYCPACTQAWWACLDITDGRISKVHLYPLDTPLRVPDVSIYLKNPDGTYRPMVEWIDRQMPSINEDVYEWGEEHFPRQIANE